MIPHHTSWLSQASRFGPHSRFGPQPTEPNWIQTNLASPRRTKPAGLIESWSVMRDHHHHSSLWYFYEGYDLLIEWLSGNESISCGMTLMTVKWPDDWKICLEISLVEDEEYWYKKCPQCEIECDRWVYELETSYATYFQRGAVNYFKKKFHMREHEVK